MSLSPPNRYWEDALVNPSRMLVLLVGADGLPEHLLEVLLAAGRRRLGRARLLLVAVELDVHPAGEAGALERAQARRDVDDPVAERRVVEPARAVDLAAVGVVLHVAADVV